MVEMPKLEKFGRLSVWERVGSDAVVQCDCGSPRKVVAYDALKRGRTKSCGCLRRELRRKYTAPFYVLRNMVLSRYRSNAGKRGLEWTLTEDEANKLLVENCHYCGSVPSILQTAKWTNVSFTYNGIDRKDNGRGYVADNVVSCCKLCGHAKADMSYQGFIDFLLRAGRFQANKIFAKA